MLHNRTNKHMNFKHLRDFSCFICTSNFSINYFFAKPSRTPSTIITNSSKALNRFVLLFLRMPRPMQCKMSDKISAGGGIRTI